MQKVEGSNPFSRFAKGPANWECFSAAQLVGASEFPRTGRGPARAAYAPDLKLGGFAGEFCSCRTVVILWRPRKATSPDRTCCITIERISSCPCSSPGRALAGATATPVVLSRHVQTLAFIGFRHTARRWSGLQVIVQVGSDHRLVQIRLFRTRMEKFREAQVKGCP